MNSILNNSAFILQLGWIFCGIFAIAANFYCLYRLGQNLLVLASPIQDARRMRAIQGVMLWAPVKLLTLSCLCALFYKMFSDSNLTIAAYTSLVVLVLLPLSAAVFFRSRRDVHA